MGGPERIARAESQEGELGVFAAHFSGPKIGPFFGLIFQATRRVTHCNLGSVNAEQKFNFRGCCGLTIFLLRSVDCG